MVCFVNGPGNTKSQSPLGPSPNLCSWSMGRGALKVRFSQTNSKGEWAMGNGHSIRSEKDKGNPPIV